MRFVLLAAPLALVACSNEVKDAETERDMLRNSGAGNVEMCNAQKKVATAYLHQHNEERFKFEKMLADGACVVAQIEGNRPSDIVDSKPADDVDTAVRNVVSGYDNATGD